MQSYANKRKTGTEQYYTVPEVVNTCLETAGQFFDLSSVQIIEPAGGTGEFIKALLKRGVPKENIESYDIEPKHPMVTQSDYLKQTITRKKTVVVSITNPPFGRASSLAKKFFNKDAEICDYICYLVPRAWRKWSVHNSLDTNFHLVADVELPKNCFYLPDGTRKEKDVLNTVFQVWERRDTKRKKIDIPDNNLIEKVIPVERNGSKVIEGANFSIVTFGHSCGKCFDIVEDTVPYKTTTMYLKIKKQEVKDAMRKIDLSKYYDNVSYVQALSIKEINYELNEHFGLKNFQF